jgi:hypothetical protein
MTNLFDFLSEWHTSVKIYVKSKDGKIYSGLISDIDALREALYQMIDARYLFHLCECG